MAEHTHLEAEAEAEAQPARAAAAREPHTLVLQLQRTVGNRAVSRWLQREAAPALDEKDMEALKAYGEVFKLQQQSSADPARLADAKRAAIVKLALSQVGKVRDQPGPDGKKIGWERLREFYRVACPSYTPAYDKGIATVGMWAGQQKPSDPRTGLPWSWCAIFGVWAIHQITGIGWFAGKPIGLGEVHHLNKTPEENAGAVKPGDMICRREQWAIDGKPRPLDKNGKPVQDLNHQCLVGSVDTSQPKSPKVTTINGNGNYQEIHVRTEPLANYWGFYDALSETDFAKYEAKIRKQYGWAVKAREKAGLAGVSN